MVRFKYGCQDHRLPLRDWITGLNTAQCCFRIENVVHQGHGKKVTRKERLCFGVMFSHLLHDMMVEQAQEWWKQKVIQPESDVVKLAGWLCAFMCNLKKKNV